MISIFLARACSYANPGPIFTHILQNPAQSSLISSFPLGPFSLPTIRLRPTLKILTGTKQNFHQSWHASQAILKFSSFPPSLNDIKVPAAYTSPTPLSNALCHQDSYPITALTLFFLDPSVLCLTVNHPFLQEPVLSLGSIWVHLQSLWPVFHMPPLQDFLLRSLQHSLRICMWSFTTLASNSSR